MNKTNTATTDSTAVTTTPVNNTATSDSTSAATTPVANTATSDSIATTTTPVANTATSDSIATTTTPVANTAAPDSATVTGEEDLANGSPYKVKRGDTLWDIAKNELKKKFEKVYNKQILQYVQQLVDQNNINNGELIYVDQTLTLPEFDDKTPAYQPPQKQSSKKKKEEELPTVYLKEDRTGNTPYKENDDYVVGKFPSNPSPTPTITLTYLPPLSTVKTDDDFMW